MARRTNRVPIFVDRVRCGARTWPRPERTNCRLPCGGAPPTARAPRRTGGLFARRTANAVAAACCQTRSGAVARPARAAAGRPTSGGPTPGRPARTSAAAPPQRLGGGRRASGACDRRAQGRSGPAEGRHAAGQAHTTVAMAAPDGWADNGERVAPRGGATRGRRRRADRGARAARGGRARSAPVGGQQPKHIQWRRPAPNLSDARGVPRSCRPALPTPPAGSAAAGPQRQRQRRADQRSARARATAGRGPRR